MLDSDPLPENFVTVLQLYKITKQIENNLWEIEVQQKSKVL